MTIFPGDGLRVGGKPRASRLLGSTALVACLACSVLAVSGCGTLRRLSNSGGWGGSELSVTSVDDSRTLAPKFSTAVYIPIDPQTAEVYLSDLPPDRLANLKDPLGDAVGSLMHVHVFLVPSAGNTPIDDTACNVTIRHLLLAGPPKGVAASDTPAMGLYTGAGFVLPSGTIGEESLGGSITQAAHRLARATPGFDDLLIGASASGRFNATRNDALAKTLAARFDGLTRRLPPFAGVGEINKAPGSEPDPAPAPRGPKSR